MAEPVLQVRDLTTSFRIEGRWCDAIRNVSFDLYENETLCLVGESGCGKSITAMSIMRLLPDSKKCRFSGRAIFEGRNLLGIDEPAMRSLRGSKLSMIFQEPMTSLNPVLTAGQQVAEPLIEHRGMSTRDARMETLRLFDLVKIPDARKRIDQYPHQFSGGMRQRVMIAMALACRPKILLADEPTTALDVTIQAQVLSLLNELRDEIGMSVIFITHDMGVVASLADRVAVMYAGEIVELGDCRTVFRRSSHPYTEALLRSIPRSDRDVGELIAIEGRVPPITGMPDGCRFADRCSIADARCEARHPLLEQGFDTADHSVRCLLRGTQP